MSDETRDALIRDLSRVVLKGSESSAPSAADRERATAWMRDDKRPWRSGVAEPAFPPGPSTIASLAAEFAAVRAETEARIDREVAKNLDAMFRKGWRDCREAAARECETHAVLNDAVEGNENLVEDVGNGIVASATGHRAMEARECAFAIRALEPKEAERATGE